MRKEYTELSDVQKKLFRSICGQDYIPGTFSGGFIVVRPYDKEWEFSPWHFSFVFQKDTGHLFCQLSHRMTNTRTSAWDYNGKSLDAETVDKVFPDDDGWELVEEGSKPEP